MQRFALIIALILAAAACWLGNDLIFTTAKIIGDIFISLLKLISLPLVFFSITATISGLKNSNEVKYLTKKTLFYTICTTIIAATIALVLYLLFDPVGLSNNLLETESDISAGIPEKGYLPYLISLIPTNFIQVFLDNNVIGCILLAFLIGGAMLSLPAEKKDSLHSIFSALFDTLLEIAKGILKFMPVAVWAFITTFLHDLSRSSGEISSIFWYFSCVILANLLQAFVVLPLMLWIKGVPLLKTAKGIMPALIVAFFSKSSSATLPTTLQCAQEGLQVDKKLSSFILPICTTINMNACAAFILLTVLFVSEMNGYHFSLGEMIIWVLLASGAAVGNAGVPMGCYFMATSYLIAMKMPLYIMGIILPFYTILDMLETAVNVWSDVCVLKVVEVDANKRTTSEENPLRYEK